MPTAHATPPTNLPPLSTVRSSTATRSATCQVNIAFGLQICEPLDSTTLQKRPLVQEVVCVAGLDHVNQRLATRAACHCGNHPWGADLQKRNLSHQKCSRHLSAFTSNEYSKSLTGHLETQGWTSNANPSNVTELAKPFDFPLALPRNISFAPKFNQNLKHTSQGARAT
jgi:hypothetical protein